MITRPPDSNFRCNENVKQSHAKKVVEDCGFEIHYFSKVAHDEC